MTAYLKLPTLCHCPKRPCTVFVGFARRPPIQLVTEKQNGVEKSEKPKLVWTFPRAG